VLVFLVIDPQMPLSILREAMTLDEFIFLCGRGLMFAPCVPLVENKLSCFDQILGLLEARSVQMHGHVQGSLSAASAQDWPAHQQELRVDGRQCPAQKDALILLEQKVSRHRQ
jgi:hypothetical protein